MRSASDCRARFFSASLLAVLAFATGSSALAQYQHLPKFEQSFQNMPGHPDPNSQFVVLNSGIASIAAQRFALPKDTFTYNLAGMTVFPYYQASPELKEFLNNATTFGGMPLTAFPTQPNLPQFTLPQTDTIRFSVPIPKIREDRASAMKMAMKDKRMKDEIPWMVANEGGQAFGLPGDTEALVIVKQGSMFGACASRTMVLRCGTMWVMTGSRPAAVITKYGAVGVRPNSIAAIEQTWFNKVTAADLYGQPLEIQLTAGDKPALKEMAISKLIVEKGKELILADSAVASSGTSDFADSGKEVIPELKDVNKVLPDLKILKAKVDADASAFVSDLKTINPPFSNLKMSTDYSKMFEEFGITAKMRREEMKRQDLMKSNIASKNAVYKVSMDSKYYVPVYSKAQEKGPQIFPNVADELNTVKLSKGNAKVLGTCDLKADANGKPVMSTGEAVVAASEPILMELADCRVWIAGGAVAQLSAKNDIVIVRNLSEQRANSVKVKVKGRNIELPIGAEIVVAKSAPELFTELKNDGVERRNVHSIEISDGSAMINKSDIRLTTLMQYSPILRKLYKSQDINDKKLVAQLMKTNVALNMVAPAQNYRRMAGLPASN